MDCSARLVLSLLAGPNNGQSCDKGTVRLCRFSRLKSRLKSTKVVRLCRFLTRFQLSIIEIEIDKGRSTVHEILIEIDKLININVKPRPKPSRELPDRRLLLYCVLICRSN
jgi:hypothetical protein